MVSDRTRSRGQLILVGALLLATVIFGLSMLINSMLFTGASSDTGASAAVEETNFLDYDVELAARELIVRLNHEDRNVTAAELTARTERQMRNFSRALGEARARSGSVAVSVEFAPSSSYNGTRIVQSHSADMGETDVVSGSRVGWFSMSANASEMGVGDAITVTASNSSKTHVELDIERTDNGTNVTSDPDWQSEHTHECGGERGRVLLDLYAGAGFTDDCQFTGIGALDRPDDIEFDGGGDFQGKYAIVTNRSWSDPPGFDTCVQGGTPLPQEQADPCVAPAVWNATITTNVVGDSVEYENTYNLTVYTNER